MNEVLREKRWFLLKEQQGQWEMTTMCFQEEKYSVAGAKDVCRGGERSWDEEKTARGRVGANFEELNMPC